MELTPTETHPEVDERKAVSLAEYLQTDRFQKHLAATLPGHMSSERFASIALRTLGQTPKLQECTLRSIVGGMMTAAVLGLEIGTQGECFLIPYKVKGVLEAQLQIGVWGHMALAWRSDQIADVQIDVVHKGDQFKFQKGTEGFLHHIPEADRNLDDPDLIDWVYAVVRTVRGGRIFDAFSKAWIERIRNMSKAPHSPAWMDWYAEQAMAKALKRVLKVCPKSREMARAITLDDEADAGAKQVWEVDTSLLLPSEVSLDPKTEAARKTMAEMGASPGRQPDPVPAQRPAEQPRREPRGGDETQTMPASEMEESMRAARDAEDGDQQRRPYEGSEEPPPPEDPGNLGW